MPAWPKQTPAALNQFYGNPTGRDGMASAQWERDYLVWVPIPWKCKLTWADQAVTRMRVNKNCANSLTKVLGSIWIESGKRQSIIHDWGMDLFGGAYNYRLMRGSSKLSTHAWGCAVDFDPARNGLGDYTPILLPSHPVAVIFKSEGWVHGADWNGNLKVMDERRPDAMHFQAAEV